MNSPLSDTGPSGLYATDHGQLPIETRRALCKLITGPFLDADHPSWPALLRDEAIVKERLSDLFLDLIIDRDRKVAFSRQADTGELDTPVLLRAQSVTFLESVLLLYLRQAMVQADGQDQRAVVSAVELIEHLSLYAAPEGADPVAAANRVEAAIEKMKVLGVLRLLRGGEKRYELSPVLRLLFTADDVQSLTNIYRTLASSTDATENEDLDDE